MRDDEFERIWDDQHAFQRELGIRVPTTYAERAAQTKEMVLHLHSEADELLRAVGAWKAHRRIPVEENRPAVKIEAVDVLKYLMIICQIHNITPYELYQAYWDKSMVVRQRFSEEFVQDLTVPSVVVDIDGVLADYVLGFCDWMLKHKFIGETTWRTARERRYLTAMDLDMGADLYNSIRRDFRLTNEHRRLGVVPGAQALLQWIRDRRWAIILMTARPIHEFPNLHSDTLVWLHTNRLPFDRIWWARDKGSAITDRTKPGTILFAVDDEYQYIEQYKQNGIPAFWFVRGVPPPAPAMATGGQISSLSDISDVFEVNHVQG